jgi:hypothetical protein
MTQKKDSPFNTDAEQQSDRSYDQGMSEQSNA